MKRTDNQTFLLELGTRIRVLRESMPAKKRMSQEEFAWELDIEPNSLSRIENGLQSIDVQLLTKLSRITQKSYYYILTGKEDKIEKNQK